MRFEQLIRLSPRIFVLAGVLDFAKQVLWVLPYWLQRREVAQFGDTSALDTQFKLNMANRILDLILYPLAWLGTAIIITLLLALYDERKASRSEAAE